VAVLIESFQLVYKEKTIVLSKVINWDNVSDFTVIHEMLFKLKT